MKVLITYASAGAGHRRAAEAVYDYLKNNREDLELELADVLTYADPFLRFCYNRGYPFLVHYTAWLWGFFFWMTEFYLTRWISRKLANWTNCLGCHKFRGLLLKGNFDFIISTHFLNSELAADLKLKNKIKSKLITIITDFGVHPFWVSGGTDLYIAASGLTKARLIKAGVSEQKIRVFGIPVNSGFIKSYDRAKLAAKFGIEADKFTVLIMTGSFGSGPLDRIAESILGDLQVLVVCAKNQKLFTRLNYKNLKNVKVFGFVDNAEELMAVSDIMITKPGGSSIAELLNMGLLPIFISAIPGQEHENIKVLAAYGLGFAPVNISQIKRLVLDLKSDASKLENLKRNIALVAKPHASQEISRVIC
ncbi:MAG: glycosyltransferase [Candidatus Omnitrophica bacterium]|jgi:processive 1,2-diacylglycerol beta-glucosyltransferase|nr:glycosyltransferase [Candidatus Omnitrophota bacterium]MDD5660381.1 glycosyltransferase [Candidatus Omnitrophota bacterium]